MGVNQFFIFCLFVFLFYLLHINSFFIQVHLMQHTNNDTVRTECPTDMKEMALEREFHKLSFYGKKKKKKK